MNKLIIIVIGFVVIVAAIFFIAREVEQNQANTIEEETPVLEENAGIVVRMTENGFEPKEITVPVGTAVSFSNETLGNRWPASGTHPTHDVYPEFDPQRPVPAGGSWIFTFEKIGTWGYHDHMFPNMTGSIKVQ